MRKKHLTILLALMILGAAGIILYTSYRDSKTAHVSLAVEHLVRPNHILSVYGSENDRLQEPLDVAVSDDGRIYVADTGNSRIAVFDSKGNFLSAFGDSGAGKLFYPTRLHIGNNGRLYVTDPVLKAVLVYGLDGSFMKELQGRWGIPGAVAADGEGTLFVADLQKHKIIVLGDHVTTVREIGKEQVPEGFPDMPFEEGRLKYPNYLNFDSKGNLWVADSNNARLQVFNADGDVIMNLTGFQKTGEKFSLPRSLSFDSGGRLYVADTLANKIYVFSERYEPLFAFGGMGLEEGKLFMPSGIALDKRNRLYVAEKGTHRVSVFESPVSGKLLPMNNRLKPVIPLTLITLVGLYSYSALQRKKKIPFRSRPSGI